MFCNEFCCSALIFAALLLSSAKLLKINETSPLWRRQDTSATMKICGRTYAVSVDSVGGHTITARR